MSSVIRGISGTRLVLSTFVSCTALEAASRECARKGIQVGSAEGARIIAAIDDRNKADATRDNDPLIPDIDALDYWHTGEPVPSETGPLLVRSGVGTLAVRLGRQIYFDTTPFRLHDYPREAMLGAADQMFGEALEQV